MHYARAPELKRVLGYFINTLVNLLFWQHESCYDNFLKHKSWWKITCCYYTCHMSTITRSFRSRISYYLDLCTSLEPDYQTEAVMALAQILKPCYLFSILLYSHYRLNHLLTKEADWQLRRDFRQDFWEGFVGGDNYPKSTIDIYAVIFLLMFPSVYSSINPLINSGRGSSSVCRLSRLIVITISKHREPLSSYIYFSTL